jgi:hypothetical protein
LAEVVASDVPDVGGGVEAGDGGFSALGCCLVAGLGDEVAGGFV